MTLPRVSLLTCALLAAVALPLLGDDLPKKGQKKVDLKELPPAKTDNGNALIKKYRDKLELSASSTYPGWPTSHALDGNVQTSWFSASNDSAAKRTTPWFQVTFPEDVTVKRVTILGNRDPAWLNGYTILAGALELLDAKGKRIHYEDNEGVGNFRDFEFKPEKPVAKVRAVKFISLGDQGDQNPYGDIAIAEVLIE